MKSIWMISDFWTIFEGNIGRTCLGLNARLHLIKPYGFNIDDKSVRRAGLDYWWFFCDFSSFFLIFSRFFGWFLNRKQVKLTEYENYDEFKSVLPSLGKGKKIFKKFNKILFTHISQLISSQNSPINLWWTSNLNMEGHWNQIDSKLLRKKEKWKKILKRLDNWL